MSKLAAQVQEFMTAMAQFIGERPSMPPEKVIQLRASLIIEESYEMLEAVYPEHTDIGTWLLSNKDKVLRAIHNHTPQISMVDFADALGDIDYVVEGARAAFGIDGQPIADEIHRANMTKLGGPISPEGKKLKPEGWLPPNIRQCLIEQGWVPPVE
jgi:predicted HAD superfamily Cof-like phosphohydrolase